MKIWLRYDNLKIVAKMMKMSNLVHPSKRVEIKQIFKLSYLSQIFINSKKVSEFWKAFWMSCKIPTSILQIHEDLIKLQRFLITLKNHLNMVISIVNFQSAITQPNLGQFVKSQAFLNFSLNALQDSGIGLWIWLSLRGVMKGFSRVISYRRRTCMYLQQILTYFPRILSALK